MAEKKSKKKNKKTEVPDAGAVKDQTDLLNRAQIDEVPKNPPRIDSPDYQPPIRL